MPSVQITNSSLPATDFTKASFRRPSVLSCPHSPQDDVSSSATTFIRSNPLLARPDFDFSSYAVHRSYIAQVLRLGGSECTSLLDVGVHTLLPNLVNSTRSSTANYTIREAVSLKGLGMFATCDLRVGSSILVEHPTLIAPFITALSNPLSDLYTELFEQLSSPARQELMSLSPGPLTECGSIPERIVRTNGVAVELKVPDSPHAELAMHRAVFLNMSRCNHSCGPNAAWDWDPSTLSITLSAVRPISKHEEVTVAYIAPDQSRSARLSALHETYGFECQCTYCIHPHIDDIVNSNLAREQIAKTWESDLPSFEEWCMDLSIPDDTIINATLRSLCLMYQEGLEVLDAGPGVHPNRDVGRHMDLLAMCYGALEDVDSFHYWIAQVKELRMVHNPEQAIVFKKWISNPSSFPVWGWRRSLQDGENEEGASTPDVCESLFEFA